MGDPVWLQARGDLRDERSCRSREFVMAQSGGQQLQHRFELVCGRGLPDEFCREARWEM